VFHRLPSRASVPQGALPCDFFSLDARLPAVSARRRRPNAPGQRTAQRRLVIQISPLTMSNARGAASAGRPLAVRLARQARADGTRFPAAPARPGAAPELPVTTGNENRSIACHS